MTSFSPAQTISSTGASFLWLGASQWPGYSGCISSLVTMRCFCWSVLNWLPKKTQVLRCSIKIYWKQSFGSETCKWKFLIWKFQEIHKSTSAKKTSVHFPFLRLVIYLFYVYLGHRCSNLPLTFWGPQTCHQITPCDCFTSHLSMWGTFHESSWLVHRDHYVVGYYNLHITG